MFSGNLVVGSSVVWFWADITAVANVKKKITGTLLNVLDNYMIWSFRHPTDVFSLSFKEFKLLFLIAIATCAILTPLHPGRTTFGWGDKQNATKMSKICTKIETIFM